MTYHLLGDNVEVIEAVLPALGGGATRSRNPSRPPFKPPPRDRPTGPNPSDTPTAAP